MSSAPAARRLAATLGDLTAKPVVFLEPRHPCISNEIVLGAPRPQPAE